MRFGILGPLAVWTADGTPVAIPEVKVRTLLAVLLLHRGKSVSTDRLAACLWGDTPPGNPANTLQTKVSQLRRALQDAEPGGRDLVVRQAPGYLLRVDAGAVDAEVFPALTARAGATADPGARAAILTEALDLWRGPALADFADEEFAQAAVARLTEQRLTALEDRAEARLAMGEHDALVAELGELVARHPLRERLRAVQLRALYRAGRQSEALAGYAGFRAHLAEELGLDPSPELAALHQAILTHDPALDAPSATTRPRTNLPAPLTELLGREDAVRRVHKLLTAGRLVTLTGPGGVGKTRLAIEAATRLVDAFPDGVRLAELSTADNRPDSVADVVATALDLRDDVAGSRPGTPADRLVDAVRDKHLLLVLDNCEHVVEPVAALAHRLLTAAPALHVLATSQETLGLTGEQLMPVPPLEVPDEDAEPAVLHGFSAVRLFEARAAAAAPGFTVDSTNAAAVATVCRRLDGLPLALELAATRLRVLDVHELADRLDDRFRLLAAGPRDAPARQRTLRAMIDWSWELLTGAERVVLRRLAVHADGCTLDAAEAVCAGDGVRPQDVLDLLARLVDRSLVSTAGGRYQLLESVSAYCVERMRESGELTRVEQRHTRYYTELAERADRHLRGREQQRWLERLDAETANTRLAFDRAVAGRHSDLAVRLVNAMTWYWMLRGRLGEARRALDRTAAIAQPLPAATETRLICVSLLRGDAVDGAKDRVLARYRDGGPSLERGMSLWLLAFALFDTGDVLAGYAVLDRAMADFRALDDKWGVAAALALRTRYAALRGELAAVRGDGERTAALFAELGDRWGQLQVVHPLATLAEITGDYLTARRWHRDGLRIAEDLGLWPEAAYRLAALGRIALLAGEHAQAVELHERAKRLADDQGFRFGAVYAEMGLGLIARRQGRLDDAERHLLAVQAWYEEMAPEPGNSLVLAELGFIAELRGDAAKALELHTAGLAAARRAGDPRAVALAFEGLAGAHSLTGDTAEAATLLEQAADARAAAGAPLPPAERADVDRITQRLTASSSSAPSS